jgi:hypothetical protein
MLRTRASLRSPFAEPMCTNKRSSSKERDIN